LLREHGPLKPARIAEALELKPNTARQTCKRMAEAGQLRATADGTYHPTAEGDSSDAPGVSPLSPLSLQGCDQHERE
jgi:Mn-dependent DtxR family transcriptional regulator